MADKTEKRTVQLIMDGRQPAQSLAELNADIRTMISHLRTAKTANEKAMYGGHVRKLKAEYQELNSTLLGTNRNFNSLKNTILATTVGVLGGNLLTSMQVGITSYISGTIDYMAKTSDELADIRRVADLSADEVDRLNEGLGDIGSRTSTSDLRGIAIVTGKLGVAKEEIKDFTEVVDQMVVALGDELGDADALTTKLGKILQVFGQDINAENMQKLANAFVHLANTGVATGEFISEFMQKSGGLAQSSGITLGKLVGLSAGFEELGAKVESGSTAMSSILVDIAKDIPKAAAIAGKSAKEFEKLFGEDPAEAMLQFAQGLSANDASFTQFVAKLEVAGEEGVRVIEALSKMGQNADFLRERMDAGTESIQHNNEIVEAFNLKNETAGARLAKLGKEFAALKASTSVQNFLSGAITGAEKFVAITKWVAHGLSTIGPLIKVAAVYWTLYATAKLRLWAIERGYLTFLSRAVVVEKARAAALILTTTWTDLLSGKIKIATIVQAAFNRAAMLNPYLWIPAAIAGIVALTNKLSDARKESYKLAEANAVATVQTEFNAELSKTEKIIQNIDKLTEDQLSVAASFAERKVEKLKSNLKTVQDELFRLGSVSTTKLEHEYDPISGGMTSRNVKISGAEKAELDKQKAVAKATEEGIKKQIALERKLIGLANAAIKEKGQDRSKIQEELSEKEKAALEKAREDRLRDEAEFAKKLEDLIREANRAEVAVIEDEMQRELAMLALGHREKLDQIKKEEAEAVALAKKLSKDTAAITEASNKLRLGADAEYYRAKKEMTEKYLKEIAETEYELEIKNLTEQYARRELITTKLYQDGLISEEQFISEKNELELWGLIQRKQIALDYGKDITEIEQAIAEHLIAIQEDKFQKVKQLLIAEAELRTRLAQLAVDKANQKGFGRQDANKELYNAELDELLTKLMAQEELIEMSEENILKIKEKYRAEFDELDAEYAQIEMDRRKEISQFTFDQISQVLSMAFNFRQEKLQAELNSAMAARDAELAKLDEERDRKLMSEEDYSRRKAAIEERYRQKEAAIKRKQARAEKIAALFTIGLETAKNITEAFPNIPLMVAAAVLGTVQAAMVAAKPVPTYGKGVSLTDRILRGPSHASKYQGIDMIDPSTGKLVARAEGGEVLLSKNTYANNREVVDALLYSSQRRGGSTITQMPRFMQERPTINYGSLAHNIRTTTMARGGIIDPAMGRRNPSTGKEIRYPQTDQEMIKLMRLVAERLAVPAMAIFDYDYYTKRIDLLNEQQKNGNPGKG